MTCNPAAMALVEATAGTIFPAISLILKGESKGMKKLKLRRFEAAEMNSIICQSSLLKVRSPLVRRREVQRQKASLHCSIVGSFSSSRPWPWMPHSRGRTFRSSYVMISVLNRNSQSSSGDLSRNSMKSLNTLPSSS